VPVPTLLLTSLSAKKALFEAVRGNALRFNPKARLIGADSNPKCQAASNVDEFLHMSRIQDLDAEKFFEFTKMHGITHVIPTREEDLQFFSRAREELCEHGIHCFVTGISPLLRCQDKLEFFEHLQNLDLPVIPTSLKVTNIEGEKVVVKERCGSGSAGVGLNLSRKAAEKWAEGMREPIFQPYIEGKEFSSEAWLDQNGRAKGIVLRWREKVVNGESHVTTTFQHQKWENTILDAMRGIGLTGHALAQAIVDEDEHLHLVEINARLGGASPLSLVSGLNSIEWFLRETAGESMEKMPFFRCPTGKRLVREKGIVRIESA